MGSIYKQKWTDQNGAVHLTTVWWIKYYRDGKPLRESSGSEKYTVARDLLKEKEGSVVNGVPISLTVNRVRFSELAADMITDYELNEKRSLKDLERRLKLHILPIFGARRAASITTEHIKKFILDRQKANASAGEINRELTAIKRAFSLASQSTPPKILHKPYIPMLRENNIRKGFFEDVQYNSVLRLLPTYARPVIEFAYITGWRIPSEILKLQWGQVDFLVGEVRLDPGTTKNDDGRTFPFTADLRALLQRLHADTRQLERKKGIRVPWVFHREGKRIGSFRKVWARVCMEAGLPVVIHYKKDSTGNVVLHKQGSKKGKPVIFRISAAPFPHDFRRTAVRNLVRKYGISESVAMKMTGHKTRSVFERYSIVSAGDLTDAAQKIDAVSNRKKVAGIVSGIVASNPTSAQPETTDNLLQFNDGPVAQVDRAAVS